MLYENQTKQIEIVSISFVSFTFALKFSLQTTQNRTRTSTYKTIFFSIFLYIMMHNWNAYLIKRTSITGCIRIAHVVPYIAYYIICNMHIRSFVYALFLHAHWFESEIYFGMKRDDRFLWMSYFLFVCLFVVDVHHRYFCADCSFWFVHFLILFWCGNRLCVFLVRCRIALHACNDHFTLGQKKKVIVIRIFVCFKSNHSVAGSNVINLLLRFVNKDITTNTWIIFAYSKQSLRSSGGCRIP